MGSHFKHQCFISHDVAVEQRVSLLKERSFISHNFVAVEESGSLFKQCSFISHDVAVEEHCGHSSNSNVLLIADADA